MEIGLKALQRLAKEMEDGVRFDPPINYRETDVDALITDIRENAKDLDAVQDADAISDAGKKTLIALDAGPWQEAKEPEPAEATTEDEEEEGEKPKKEDKKMKKTVKKKAAKVPVKKAVIKTEKKVKPKKEKKVKGKQQKKKEIRGQGIGNWIKEQLKKNKDITNTQLAEEARKRFSGAKTSPACISWYRARV